MITVTNHEGLQVQIDLDLLELLKKEFEKGRTDTYISVKGSVHSLHLPDVFENKKAAALTAAIK
jgi:hypothetical protein